MEGSQKSITAPGRAVMPIKNDNLLAQEDTPPLDSDQHLSILPSASNTLHSLGGYTPGYKEGYSFTKIPNRIFR